ncbi:hypothetical protein HA147_06940 [Prochlorococcus marinus XMU1410]|uniref:hypothetical protein n=1 Tax=Prochlorococcus marinus TaxID=1219 RepID=UPI001ADC5935|nr:hypothetical protein [Prochlorococcus marinus]MBO8242385.1 hypothetical protein [Prochlorococcus marinus XMU1410]
MNSVFLILPFNSSSIFASELLKDNNNQQTLIAETRGYREHKDASENDDDFHSIDHNWSNHYHTIRSIKIKRNGNLKIRFCEKVELLEGQVYADNIKYDVKDAYKIKKRSIIWKLNKKGTFKKGSTVFVNTKDFLGRPIEKDPNPNEIRSLVRGCGIPFLYLPPGIEVSDDSSSIGLIGVIVGLGIAIGGGSSGGSGSSSSN